MMNKLKILNKCFNTENFNKRQSFFVFNTENGKKEQIRFPFYTEALYVKSEISIIYEKNIENSSDLKLRNFVDLTLFFNIIKKNGNLRSR